MVEVARVGTLSSLRRQRSSRQFPDDERRRIVEAVRAVPTSIFGDGATGTELRRFDARLAKSLSDYAFEHGGDGGRNPACKLWRNEGFDHSVDLYHADHRIAIEVEKSERKRVSDDLLKFIKGGRTRRDGRPKIEFGCLVVPVNYRGSGNIHAAAMTTLSFMRGVLFVEDVLVVGYRDHRWD